MKAPFLSSFLLQNRYKSEHLQPKKIWKNKNVKNCVIFRTNLHCKAFVVANVCVCTRFIHPQCDTIDQDNYHGYSLKPSIVKNLIKSKMDKGLCGNPKIVYPSLL